MIQFIIKSKDFHFAILKMNFNVQEAIFVDSVKKTHFQALLEGENQSRRGGRQEIEGLRCLKNSITGNIQECFTLSKNMHIYIEKIRHDRLMCLFIFNQWLR